MNLCAYAAGVQNLVFTDGGTSRDMLWNQPEFIGLSILHKLVAPVYYLMLLDTVLKLGQPRWYEKEYWLSLFQV